MDKRTHGPNDGLMPISRRDLLALGLKTAGLVSLSSLTTLAPSQMATAATQTMNFCSWGGAYQQAEIDSFQKPFTEKTGITFDNIEKSGNGPALITAQEQTGNITWDIANLTQADAIRLGSEGLLETIDFDKDLNPAPNGSPASTDFIKGSLSGDGKKGPYVSTDVAATLFAYNAKAFASGHRPQSVKDAFDLKKFPGKRALQKIPDGNLEWALYADGVDRDKIYDVLKTKAGVDRAFKKLDTIKDHVVWWTEGAQPPQMLAQDEAVIVTAFNGRIFNAIVANNQPFDFVWDGAFLVWEGWVIPANLPADRLKMAKAFLRYSTSPKVLARQPRYIPYSPSRTSSLDMLRHASDYQYPKVKVWRYLPATPEHQKTAIPQSVPFWASYGPELNQRFSAWLTS